MSRASFRSPGLDAMLSPDRSVADRLSAAVKGNCLNIAGAQFARELQSGITREDLREVLDAVPEEQLPTLFYQAMDMRRSDWDLFFAMRSLGNSLSQRHRAAFQAALQRRQEERIPLDEAPRRTAEQPFTHRYPNKTIVAAV